MKCSELYPMAACVGSAAPTDSGAFGKARSAGYDAAMTTHSLENARIRWAVESADALLPGVSDETACVPLAPSEREYLATLRHPLRRRDWLLGRWTAKRLVQEILPDGFARAEEISVAYEPSGAPALYVHNRRCGLALSISHCEGWAFCAVAGKPRAGEPRAGEPSIHIGADIERVRAGDDHALADLLTPCERAQVTSARLTSARLTSAQGERAELAAAIWCAKEAAGKALRTGLGLNPDRFVCRLEAQPGCAGWKPLTVSVESHNLPGWYCILQLRSNMRCALALVVSSAA
jgi:4'-phosphopantetheinyl transferase